LKLADYLLLLKAFKSVAKEDALPGNSGIQTWQSRGPASLTQHQIVF
jgi:hypothetical protein